MTTKNIKNIPASLRAKLLNYSKESGEDFNLILTRYGLERMLYRISQSEYRDQFLLKGAMLFSIWQDIPHRPTRDADFLGLIDPEIEEIKKIFQSLCNLKVEKDGISFDSKSVSINEIRENNAYEGIRVKIKGNLDDAKIPIQIDIGFGDIVTPDPQEIEYPTLLDQLPPILKAYPVYSVISEKFEAMIKLGMINTRMKDIYDIWRLIKKFDFDREILKQAITNTFTRRKTAIPDNMPVAFQPEFYNDDAKIKQWQAFLNKNGIEDGPNLKEAIEDIQAFLMPIIQN